MPLMVGKLQNWLDAGLGLIYPEILPAVPSATRHPREGFVCAQCWTQVHFIRPPFCDRCGLPFTGELTRHL